MDLEPARRPLIKGSGAHEISWVEKGVGKAVGKNRQPFSPGGGGRIGGGFWNRKEARGHVIPTHRATNAKKPSTHR